MPVIIMPTVVRNYPSNLNEYKKYPPEKYPIKLSIWFSKTANNFEFDGKLQESLKLIPKSKLKYRQTGKYVRNYDCYVSHIQVLKPVFDKVLSKTEMWERYVEVPDQQINIDKLYQYAYDVLENDQK